MGLVPAISRSNTSQGTSRNVWTGNESLRLVAGTSRIVWTEIFASKSSRRDQL